MYFKKYFSYLKPFPWAILNYRSITRPIEITYKFLNLEPDKSKQSSFFVPNKNNITIIILSSGPY
jgi:hypothetical protein